MYVLCVDLSDTSPTESRNVIARKKSWLRHSCDSKLRQHLRLRMRDSKDGKVELS